jgi:hypothetical protein
MNGPMIFGGAVIILTGMVAMTIYLIKKKRIKQA